MATMTVSLAGPMRDWVEAKVKQGDYATASDYVRDLVLRDRDRADTGMSLDELRRKLAASRESGVSDRTIDDVFAEAKRIAEARGLLHG